MEEETRRSAETIKVFICGIEGVKHLHNRWWGLQREQCVVHELRDARIAKFHRASLLPAAPSCTFFSSWDPHSKDGGSLHL